MSLLDIDERLLQIAELADIRATPITDLKQPDESGVAVGMLEGGINNSSNEEVAKRMRSTLPRCWLPWVTAPCLAACLRCAICAPCKKPSDAPMWISKATMKAEKFPTIPNWPR